MSAAYESEPGVGRPPESAPLPPSSGVGGRAVALLGLATVLIAAWGGILPYVGPLFGYRLDVTSAWVFSLPHGVLGLAPGAAGVLAGSAMLSAATRVRYGLGRTELALAGLLATVVGAWFVLGPSAWPVLEHARYLHARSATALLAHVVGASIGPGVLLVLFGGMALGWALRHRGASALLVGRTGGAPRHLAAVATQPTPQA